MPDLPDDVMPGPEPEDLSALSMTQLRDIRTSLQEVEDGVSYARRLAQGRLDTLDAERHRRGSIDDPTSSAPDLQDILPEALAAHGRGPGLPRPNRDLDPPSWADRLLEELEEAVPPAMVAALAEVEPTELDRASKQVAAIEHELSAQRADLHRRINGLQEELISRYREGAGVDDLLT